MTKEKPVYYAEIAQLYVPSAGVIEGAHYVSIRPAQGEMGELLLRVPDWRDRHRRAGSAQSRIAGLLVAIRPGHAAIARHVEPGAIAALRACWCGRRPPPGRCRSSNQLVLLSVENAAGQIGLAGIATGGEVQLDAVSAPAFSPLNLEDFPGDAVAALQGEIPGLTLRRAFRYSDTKPSST